jgi:hypothetical protein
MSGSFSTTPSSYLQARKLGYAVLTRNIGDFDLLNQLVPSGQILLYRQAPG